MDFTYPLFPMLLATSMLEAVLQTVLVVLGAFVGISLLLSHLRYQTLIRQADMDVEEEGGSTDVFRIRLSQRLGSFHRDPTPFAVALLALEQQLMLTEQHGQAAVKTCLEKIETELRKQLREEDVVVLMEENRIGMVLDTGRTDLEAMLARLVAQALPGGCDFGDGVLSEPQLLAGAATFPENGSNQQEMLTSVESALQQAVHEAGHISILPEPVGGPIPPPTDPGTQTHLIDPLTGVLKSAYLGTAMQKYVARYRKDARPVSVLYIDVDNLERYNEHYSREAGDTILKALGGMLGSCVREDDLIGRIEGEEFVVCMGCAPAAALGAAQRFSQLVKRSAIPFGETSLRVTVSTGVAGYPDHGGVTRLLFEKAMEALKIAKMKGRNSCALYRSTPTPSRPPAPRKTDAF